MSCWFVTIFLCLWKWNKNLYSRNVEYLNYAKHLLNKQEKDLKYIAGFWNKIKANVNKDILNNMNAFLDSKNMPYFQTQVEDSVKYQREGHCSTMAPCEESNATRFYEEMSRILIPQPVNKI